MPVDPSDFSVGRHDRIGHRDRAATRLKLPPLQTVADVLGELLPRSDRCGIADLDLGREWVLQQWRPVLSLSGCEAETWIGRNDRLEVGLDPIHERWRLGRPRTDRREVDEGLRHALVPANILRTSELLTENREDDYVDLVRNVLCFFDARSRGELR